MRELPSPDTELGSALLRTQFRCQPSVEQKQSREQGNVAPKRPFRTTFHGSGQALKQTNIGQRSQRAGANSFVDLTIQREYERSECRTVERPETRVMQILMI